MRRMILGAVALTMLGLGGCAQGQAPQQVNCDNQAKKHDKSTLDCGREPGTIYVIPRPGAPAPQ